MRQNAQKAALASLPHVFDIGFAAFACLYLFMSFFQAVDQVPERWGVLTAFFIDGIVAVYFIYRAFRRGMTLFFILFYFILCFESLAPIQQIGARYDIIFFDGDLVVEAAAIIAVTVAISVLFFLLTARSLRHSSPETGKSLLDIERPNVFLLLMTSIASALVVSLFYGSYQFSGREDLGAFVETEFSKGAAALLSQFLAPLCLLSAFIGFFVCWRKRRLMAWIFTPFVLLGLLLNNPWTQSRYESSSLLLFLLLAVLGYRRPRVVALFMIAGLIVSPLYNTYLRYNFYMADDRQFLSYFASMDFEAVNLFCYAIKWTQQVGYTFGNNLLGALLFFVPRELWPDKGVHPAAIIFGFIQAGRDLTSDNLSSPPDMEGYLSFGPAGAVLLSFVVVFAIGRLEIRASRARFFSAWALCGAMTPVLMLLLLRGPLQVGFSAFVMHLCAIWIAASLIGVRIGRSDAATARRLWRLRRKPSPLSPQALLKQQ